MHLETRIRPVESPAEIAPGNRPTIPIRREVPHLFPGWGPRI